MTRGYVGSGSSFRGLGLAVFWVVLGGAPAFAASADALETAQAHVDAAAVSYQAGDFEAALGSLRAAEKLAEAAGDPALASIRFNIARTLEQLDRKSEALEAYRAYDALPDASHRKQKAFSAIRALEAQIYGGLSVACAPSGAVVWVEGLTETPVPCPYQNRKAPAGMYTVSVSAVGYRTQTATTTVVAGRTALVQLRLAAEAPVASAADPMLTEQVDTGSSLSPWPFVFLGGGAAFLGAGAAFTFVALDARDRAESTGPLNDVQFDAEAEFQTHRALAYSAYGIGAALMVTGVVWFFLDGEDGGAEAARLEPTGDGLRVRF